jgi:hypothetical protein
MNTHTDRYRPLKPYAEEAFALGSGRVRERLPECCEECGCGSGSAVQRVWVTTGGSSIREHVFSFYRFEIFSVRISV